MSSICFLTMLLLPEHVQQTLPVHFDKTNIVSHQPKAEMIPLANGHQTEYLFIVTTDGTRWQEVFNGADDRIKCNQNHVYFQGKTNEERRHSLMPFFWGQLAKQGQIHGNREIGSQVEVANAWHFSYPGYSELICGYADNDRIWSNMKKQNPNTTLLEQLNQTEGFAGRVCAFGSWDVFPAIFNHKKCGFPVNAGFAPQQEAGFEHLNKQLKTCVRPWKSSVRPDSLTLGFALQYLDQHLPKIGFIGFGETDEYAHEGDYLAYLDAIHCFDNYLRLLWETLQANPVYRNKTTLMITTDHGRGNSPDTWQNHRFNIDGSDEVWFAAIGPDTPPFGEMQEGHYFLEQLAQTCAHFLGGKFSCEHPVADRVEPVFSPAVLAGNNAQEITASKR